MVAAQIWREWPENSHVVLLLMIVSSLKSSPADIWLMGNHPNGKTADQVWDLCKLCTPTRLHETDMWFCSSNNDCYTLTQLISFWSFDPNLQSRWIFRIINWDILDWQVPCWVMDIWLSSEIPWSEKAKEPEIGSSPQQLIFKSPGFLLRTEKIFSVNICELYLMSRALTCG